MMLEVTDLACGHDTPRQIDSAAAHPGYEGDTSILLECAQCGHQQWVGIRFTVAKVERRRLNDYAGPPVWGIYSEIELMEGDRVWFDQEPLFPGRRWYLEVTRINGRLACVYEDDRRICGYVK